MSNLTDEERLSAAYSDLKDKYIKLKLHYRWLIEQIELKELMRIKSQYAALKMQHHQLNLKHIKTLNQFWEVKDQLNRLLNKSYDTIF